MSEPLRRIVILGGGSAGWMTAAALGNAIHKDCEVTLVESEAIGTVGVGEATIPPIRRFNRSIGLNEKEFVQATGATFKLGIQFTDWSRLGHSYFHPFGTFGSDFDSIPLYQYWLEARREGIAGPLDEYCMAWGAASRLKFTPPVSDRRNIQSTFDYAYHFDAGLYAGFLRRFAETKGIKRREGQITKLDVDGPTGRLTAVHLDNGDRLEADFFIDCTGFRSLALGQTLGVGYQDWTHWLPCNRAVAVPCAHGGEFTPYTRSIARGAGWQWRIPLQHRIGNGHVYSSAHLTDDEAHEILLANLDGEAQGEPRLLRFTTGRRHYFWHKNVVAIGLAAGFMEPLESTSLHLIQSGIQRLLALFPDRHMDPLLAKEYNRITSLEYERIRDFLILHYHATSRDDTPFWRYCSNMTIPDSLSYKLAHFRRDGRIVADQYDLFVNASWLSVYVGQDEFPDRPDPMMQLRNRPEAFRNLESVHKAIKGAAEAMPRHDEFIARNCPADTGLVAAE